LTTFNEFVQSITLSLSVEQIIGLAIIILILKGIVLWDAARKRRPVWFVSVLVLSTLGILPLMYIIIFKIRKGEKLL